MKIFISIFISFTMLFSVNVSLKAQCNTNTNICSTGISGPYTFSTPGPSVSTCLDFWGPDYAYIILYITQSGPLEMLINGDVTTGFLDVAIFNVPTGVAPCTATLDNTNQISCNYASNWSGCNQIGNYFGCPSSVSSPYVNVGDKLMIVVENWSNMSTNFTLEMAPLPAAQSGPGDPTIDPIPISLDETSSPYQMTAIDNGGNWSGTGISSSGLFDPSISGMGTFMVRYDLGSGPCLTSDSMNVTVNSALAIELIDMQLNCKTDNRILKWSTASEVNCDYFKIEKSYDAQNFLTLGIVKGNGNSSKIHNYSFIDKKNKDQAYYRLVEVDFNGKETIYGPLHTTCTDEGIMIYPNPASEYINIKLPQSEKSLVTFEIKSIDGKILLSNILNGSIDLSHLSKGYYIISLKTENKQYIQKFILQ